MGIVHLMILVLFYMIMIVIMIRLLYEYEYLGEQKYTSIPIMYTLPFKSLTSVRFVF